MTSFREPGPILKNREPGPILKNIALLLRVPMKICLSGSIPLPFRYGGHGFGFGVGLVTIFSFSIKAVDWRAK